MKFISIFLTTVLVSPFALAMKSLDYSCSGDVDAKIYFEEDDNTYTATVKFPQERAITVPVKPYRGSAGGNNGTLIFVGKLNTGNGFQIAPLAGMSPGVFYVENVSFSVTCRSYVP